VTLELIQALGELEHNLKLLDGMPTPPNHFEVDPIQNVVLYARRVVELARQDADYVRLV
jgi:hypothetical protein